MKILLLIAIITNFITALALVLCNLYSRVKNQNRKTHDFLSFVLGYSMLAYLAIFFILIIMGIMQLRFEFCILALFVIAPFIIGHFASYDKTDKYTYIQLAVFILSLLLLILGFIYLF